MKPIRSFVVTVVVATCGFAFSFESVDSPINPPIKIYRVQVAAPADKKEAEQLQARAEQDGLTPAVVVPSDPFYKVQVGQLDCYPDAHQLRDDLRKRGYFDCFVVFDQNTGNDDALPVTLSEHSNGYKIRFLNLTYGPEVSRVDSRLPIADDLTDMTPGQTRITLKPFMDYAENTDVSKGYAAYYYALAIEREGTRATAIAAADLLGKLANRQIASPEDYQRKAALQLADLQHYTLKEYSEAYRMYKTLLQTKLASGTGTCGNPSRTRSDLHRNDGQRKRQP